MIDNLYQIQEVPKIYLVIGTIIFLIFSVYTITTLTQKPDQLDNDNDNEDEPQFTGGPVGIYYKLTEKCLPIFNTVDAKPYKHIDAANIRRGMLEIANPTEPNTCTEFSGNESIYYDDTNYYAFKTDFNCPLQFQHPTDIKGPWQKKAINYNTSIDRDTCTLHTNIRINDDEIKHITADLTKSATWDIQDDEFVEYELD
uniref:Uncharacterized protein n=1 Tax=Megaviridae environmental sample TaxID=1737588 RepID=A0A5J6VIK3_9VIRU|nr:MAG: hypothetical protein [Megaviridae environmental sample]